MRKNFALTFLTLFCFLSCSTDDPTDTNEIQAELGKIRNQLKVLEKINDQNQVSKNQEQLKTFERLVNKGHAAEVEKLRQEITDLKKQLQQQNNNTYSDRSYSSKHEFKVSQYGGGHQIWFEAEKYTERTPDTDEHWAVEKMNKAYGKTVLGPTGNFGGMLRYEFDIRAIGPKAKGGEWYMWARLVNPGNQSDFMLVEGHPGDKIPKQAPADRGGFDNKQRVFEFNVGGAPDIFGWGPASHKEGHTKILRNGKNVTVFFRRQAGTGNKMDVIMWTDDDEYQPTDQDYEKAKPKGLSVDKADKLSTFWGIIKSTH